MKKAYDAASRAIVFSFAGLEPIAFHPERAHGGNNERARIHGWMARIGDTAALSRKQKDGTVIDITEQMRRDEIQRLVSHYESGSAEWELGRTAPIDPRAVRLAESDGISIAEATAILQKVEQDAIAAFFAQKGE